MLMTTTNDTRFGDDWAAAIKWAIDDGYDNEAAAGFVLQEIPDEFDTWDEALAMVRQMANYAPETDPDEDSNPCPPNGRWGRAPGGDY